MDTKERARLDAIAQDQPPFAMQLGIRIVSASPEEVVAELQVTTMHGNRNGVMHGGALLGLADNVGGTAAFLNLAEGESSTTIESKANFFRAVAIGDTIRATATRLHKGRTTTVWQTAITRGDGKLAALVTQTQLVMRSSTP